MQNHISQTEIPNGGTLLGLSDYGRSVGGGSVFFVSRERQDERSIIVDIKTEENDQMTEGLSV